MSVTESKNSSNQNRVRFFDKSSLVESIASQKWDLVKILCTQPFNKHIQYGLSFVVLHTADEEKPKVKKTLVPERFLNQKPVENKEQAKLFAGKFKLRENSPTSESDTAMGLFNRWKLKKATPEPLTAVSIREASNNPELMREALTPKFKKIIPRCSSSKNDEGNEEPIRLDRNRMDLVFGEEEDKPNEKVEMMIQKDKERLEKELAARRTSNGSKRLSSSDLQSKSIKKIKYDSFSSSDEEKKASKNSKDKRKIESTSATPKTSSETKKPPTKLQNKTSLQKVDVAENVKCKKLLYKPFNKLLEGVTIVISGIQVSLSL